MADVVVIDAPVPQRSLISGPEMQNFLAEEVHASRAKKLQEDNMVMLHEAELDHGYLRLGEK